MQLLLPCRHALSWLDLGIPPPAAISTIGHCLPAIENTFHYRTPRLVHIIERETQSESCLSPTHWTPVMQVPLPSIPCTCYSRKISVHCPSEGSPSPMSPWFSWGEPAQCASMHLHPCAHQCTPQYAPLQCSQTLAIKCALLVHLFNAIRWIPIPMSRCSVEVQAESAHRCTCTSTNLDSNLSLRSLKRVCEFINL